jgi:heterodisulfide reductase subunit A
MERVDVLVVGGGIAGLTVASALQGKGDVLLLEEKASLGGLAVELSCKATDRCLRCGVCRATEVVRKGRIGVESITGESPRAVVREKRGFRITTDRRELAARLIVLATGAVPFPVEEFPQYLWGRRERIFTGFELERRLKDGNLEEFAAFRSLAFVQCVGSRNARKRLGYCSQVCCRYALRLAANLRFRFPEITIDVYSMDLQVLGDGQEALRDAALSVFRYRSLPFALEEDADGVTVFVEVDGKATGRRYDAVVLSVGLVASPGTQRMAELFHLPQREGGFIVPHLWDGVFACGTATGPKDITSTIFEAEKLSKELQAFLGR